MQNDIRGTMDLIRHMRKQAEKCETCKFWNPPDKCRKNNLKINAQCTCTIWEAAPRKVKA